MNRSPLRFPTRPVPSSSAEPVAPPPADSTFAPRLARASLLLAVAVAAHVWIVRAPHVERAAARAIATEPRSEVVATPSATLAAADAVHLQVQTLRVPLVGTMGRVQPRPAVPEPQPVATHGMILAKLERNPVPSTDLLPESPAATVDDMTVVNPRTTPLPYVDGPAKPSLVLAAVSSTVRPIAAAVGNAEDNRHQEQVVRDILREYTRAYERLDVRAAKAVYPSVDDRALQRAFEQLDGQQLRFGSCRVSITGPAANASCPGNATYRTKVGNRVVRLNEREWTFNLSRGEGGWQIVNARVQ